MGGCLMKGKAKTSESKYVSYRLPIAGCYTQQLQSALIAEMEIELEKKSLR